MNLCGMLGGCVAMTMAPAAQAAPDTVVLLHGMGRTSASMARLAAELHAGGYHVVNATYPSRTRTVEQIANAWLPAQLERTPWAHGVGRLHFVTHSLGGIIVRAWVREGVPPNLGHVVMLAPPNAGSEIATRLAQFAPFGWVTGVNGQRVGVGDNDLPRQLGEWPKAAGPLGIIAGDRCFNPLWGALMPRPHDGKVSVASTHLDGERAHRVVPAGHTWLAWRRDVIGYTKRFLATGTFEAASA
jgi:triacylglycerol lipase